MRNNDHSTNKNTNVIALVRGNERYVFLYDDDPLSLLKIQGVMNVWLLDDELSFDQQDWIACMEAAERNYQK